MEAIKDLPGWARALIIGAGIGVLTFAVAVRTGDPRWIRRRGSDYFSDGVSFRNIAVMVAHIATTAATWLAFYGLLKLVKRPFRDSERNE